jgi:hypothetical protein
VPTFLLPSFRGEGGEPAPKATRGWEVFPISDLERFSKALAAPKDLPANVFVDAIPDVWAKALLFAYALGDQGHTLHQRAIDSFRGFLAMLALRHIHRYDIRAVRVNIDPQSRLRFEAALARLLPAVEGSATSHVLSRAVGWNPAYVFLLGEDVVGMCSPMTLIAPHEGPDMATAAARGLTDGFRFTDPTERLGPMESSMLWQWLAGLQSHIVQNAEDGPCRVTLTDQVLAFQNALKARAGELAPDIKYASGTLNQIATQLFQPLGRALDAISGRQVASRFELQTRKSARNRVLLIDEERIQHLPAETDIITGVAVSVLKGQALGNDELHLAHFPLPDGWKWMRPSDFLLPQLTVIQTHEAFVNAAEIPIHQGKASDDSPVPPLKESVAEFIDADYVSRNCWFERTSDGFTFRLKLPLPDGQAIEAARSYQFADLKRIDAYDMPVAEIWPSRKIEDWKAFYTFWSRDSESSRFYIRPSGVEIVEPKRKMPLARTTREEVTLTKQAPGYLACFELQDTHSGIEKQPLGLLMPSFRDPQANTTPRTFTVGFDFGTTSTNVFVDTGDKKTELEIAPATVQIFNNEQPKREGLMYRLFLPAQSETAPFLSLLRRRISLAGGFEAIRDAHVLFYHQQVESAQFDDRQTVAYLKWRTAELNDDRNAFLSQLILHAAYEARLQGASTLRFVYSYPTAFDESTKEMLDAFWNNDVAEMTEITGVPCQVAGSQTESIATAAYFEHIAGGKGALLGTGAIVLDIGGGTTDISAWRERKLAIQTSVRLSGREMLLAPMKDNKNYVIPMLAGCMADGPAIFEPLEALDDERFYRRADAILRAHGDELLDRLRSLMTTETFERFRSEIALRLTALLYYSGLLLRRKKWLDSGARLPDIYVGGNGSRVFNWLAPPRFQDNHAVVDLLLNAYARGAGSDTVPTGLKLHLSPKPKSEVACGLVYAVDSPPAREDEAIENVAGESFEADSKAYTETHPLTFDLLKSGLRVNQAAEIERVLKVYNEFTERQGAILLPVSNTAEIVQRAVEKINDWAQQQIGRETKSISLAPIFVTGAVEAFSRVRWKAPDANAVSA